MSGAAALSTGADVVEFESEDARVGDKDVVDFSLRPGEYINARSG